VYLILVITSTQMETDFQLTNSQANCLCIVIEISTSPELRCYTTLWNMKIQNNCWTITFTRKNVSVLHKTYSAELNKDRSIYAAKHHRYDSLNFYDKQNDADDTATSKMLTSSHLVHRASTDSNELLSATVGLDWAGFNVPPNTL